ncbi:Hsp70 family protein [Sporichthya polymorpha]|uniref:Hsp70 family protein n=1 Tax=Sporichthya polymorpha TaxID=35751 RepID=UPI00035F9C32|nr:Hsp70 family protein [Sporichthya polymorpha]
MGYRLSVDLGTTNTAAVVHRPGTGSAPTVVRLGDRSATVPSVLFLGADGTVLMGEAAERRALTDPDRVVRRFKRRIGDETPLLVGTSGDGLTAHALAAKMIGLVADRVAEQEGGAPDAVAVTVPAAWGSHKKDLLAGALAGEGLLDVTMISEPAAAALAYAQAGKLVAGATVAVYDLGGGTFDAAVLRAESGNRFTALGTPTGIPNLGGVDFDDAVLAYVLGVAGPQTPGVEADDPMHLTAMGRLRRECVEAKEALSADTAATVPVLLGGAQTSVRVTRADFEAMIAGALEETCTFVEAALVSANLTRKNLDRILLTGGSSRIPLVTQLLSARYPGVPLERDIDPKLAVAIGGVLALEKSGRHARPALALIAGLTAAAAVAPSAAAVAASPAPAAGAPAAAVVDRPARPALTTEKFDGREAEVREGRRLKDEPKPQRKAHKVVTAAAGVILLGGFGLASLGVLDLGDAVPAGSVQEARAGVGDDGAQLQVEETGKAKDKARGERAKEKAAEEETSTSSSDATTGSAGGSASGHVEGSADSRSASAGSSSSESSDGVADSAREAEDDDVVVERPAKTERKATARRSTEAVTPTKATTPEAAPVDAVAAPSAVEAAPAEEAAPAPAAEVEEDTSTESGSVEFGDAGEESPPAP